MIYVKLKGGMGNQMFQYALGRQLAHQLGIDFSMDLTNLLDRDKGVDFVYRDYDLSIFNVKEQFLFAPGWQRTVYGWKLPKTGKLLRKLARKGKRYVRETDFHFQPGILANAQDNSLYEGWFQSPKYFAGIEDQLREDFRFQDAIIPESKELEQRILSTNSVCLNVRRTDFLKVDTLNATNLDYFLRGAAYMAERVDNPHFFIFSDDVEWCRENILLDHPVEVVNHSHKGRRFGNYLQLMSLCKHFIIPNSSFAWWAAWMNTDPGKMVVAPKMWFTDVEIDTSDLVPEKWVRM